MEKSRAERFVCELKIGAVILAVLVSLVAAFAIYDANTCSGFLCGLLSAIILVNAVIPATQLLNFLLYVLVYIAVMQRLVDNKKLGALAMYGLLFTAIVIALPLIYITNSSYSGWFLYLPVGSAVFFLALQIRLLVSGLRNSAEKKWLIISFAAPILGPLLYFVLVKIGRYTKGDI